MTKVIIIGAGGVGQVVTHKCAQLANVFTDIVLASRNEEKCKKIAAQVEKKYGRSIEKPSGICGPQQWLCNFYTLG